MKHADAENSTRGVRDRKATVVPQAVAEMESIRANREAGAKAAAKASKSSK